MKVTRKVCILLVIIVVLLIVLFLFLSKDSAQEYDEDTYGNVTKVLNESFDSQLYLYGEDLPFRENVNIVKIDSLDPTNLQKAKDINVLFIIDREGKCKITQDDLNSIAPLIINGKLDYVYVGTDKEKISMFYKAGLWSDVSLDSGELAISCGQYFNSRTFVSGVWTKYDEKMLEGYDEGLQQALMVFIYNGLESMKD